ncbi:MAG: hypothetical protein JW852_04190, partial [Spirochaetales bacterium]|nr:hypothetical protein [Spirochaetales bacterium]
EYLQSNGIPYTVSDLGQLSGAHSYSTSIEIALPGASADELILVAPLNSRETSVSPGAGAANIALALEAARTFGLRDSRLSLRVLIAGADHGDGDAYPIGSQAFLSEYQPEGNAAVLYLDFELPTGKITIRGGDRDFVAPYWFLDRCITGLDSHALPFHFSGNENQFYRLGVAANPAPLRAYLQSGYPALSFHSSDIPLPEAAIPEFAASFMGFLGSLLGHEENPTRWDRHYLFFQFGDFSLVIGELTYLVILLGVAALLILYPLLFSVRFKSYILNLIGNFWALPMLLVLMFGLLLVGTFLIEGLSALKGYPDYWMKRPAEFLVLKLMTAVFLFFLLSQYLRKIPFPRRGRFYSAAALLILISDIFLLGVVDISLAYYVLWACVWAFFFSLAPNRFLKGLCLLISPAWLIKAAYDMLTIPALEIAEQMVLTRISGNLLVAFILFPFLLMLIRLDFMFRHPKRKTKRLLLTVTFTVLGLACGGLVAYLTVTEPFSAADPQPVVLKETQHLAKSLSSIELTSPASLGDLTVQTPSDTVTISTKAKNYTIETPLKRDLLEVQTDVSRFLGRASYVLTINSKGLPSSVDVSLLSDSEIIVYDLSFPFSFESANSVKVHIGRYPPNPLSVEFTVPGELKGTIEVKAGYSNPPVAYQVTGTNIDAQQRLEVIARAAFDPL